MELHLPFQPHCPLAFLSVSDIYSLIVGVVLSSHLQLLYDRDLESSIFLWKGSDERGVKRVGALLLVRRDMNWIHKLGPLIKILLLCGPGQVPLPVGVLTFFPVNDNNTSTSVCQDPC